MEEARECYSRGDYSAAISRWEVTLKSVEYTLNSADFSNELVEKREYFIQKRTDLLLNIALASIKIGNYSKSITLCLKVISYDKYNEKALLRITKAYTLDGDYNNAIKYANIGLNIYKNQIFNKMIIQARRMRSSSHAKEVKLYKSMLNIQKHDKNSVFRKFFIAILSIISDFYISIVGNYKLRPKLAYAREKIQAIFKFLTKNN